MDVIEEYFISMPNIVCVKFLGKEFVFFFSMTKESYKKWMNSLNILFAKILKDLQKLEGFSYRPKILLYFDE